GWGAGPPRPVLGPDLRRARHRRLQALAAPPALDRAAREPARDHPGHRVAGIRPRRHLVTPCYNRSQRSQGEDAHVLIAHHLVTGSGSLAGLDEKAARGLPLPTGGLAGVYEDFLDRQVAGDEKRWAGELRPVLAPLAVAQDEGLTTEQLRLVNGRLGGGALTRTSLPEVTRTARQFLDGPAPDGPFRVYHQSFADFLVDPEQNPDFLIDAAETHEAIVAAYAATDPLSWDSYARRNLALHASEAGRLDHLLE